jgi:predicted metalloprotease with PDZ domain
MLKISIYTLISLLLSPGIVEAAPAITYVIRIPQPQTHYIEVDMQINGITADSFDVKMPVWTPGSYMVREFSRHVEGFEVMTNGNKTEWQKVKKNCWRIYKAANVKISYRVYAYELTVRTCFVDAAQAYINGAGLYMYIDEFRNQSCQVIFEPIKDWKKISTSLSRINDNPWIRQAGDYDELIDCPVVMGNHEVISFDYKGIPHHVAMIGKAAYSESKIKKDFYRIIDECTKVFGQNPLREYIFFIHNLPSGGGGLEHASSTSLMVSLGAYEDPSLYKGFMSLVAHEYFHLWLVKRLKPAELQSFNYDEEVYTRLLWFFEGFTSFYDDLFVRRTGFYSEAEYLDIVNGNIQSIENTPGAQVQTLSESSFDAWIKYYRSNENSRNSTVSYYTKGAVLASVFNLMILQYSQGNKSLDDMMKYLYEENYVKKNQGITEQDLKLAMEKFSGLNMNDFFEKYIHGVERLPYETVFEYAGLKLERTDGKREPFGYAGVTFAQAGKSWYITYVERNSAAWNDGINVNDEILAIDGQPVNKPEELIALKKPGEKVVFKLKRRGIEMEIPVTLGEPTRVEFAYIPVQKPTDLQKKIFEKWTGAKLK